MMSGMEDPVEVRERMDRFVRRVGRRDDYGTLIAAGYVVVSAERIGDTEEWRREIRRQARADRLRVRTGLGRENTLWALLQDVDRSARVAEGERYTELLRVAVPRMAEHRHEPEVRLRDGEETLFGCRRCSAFGYADSSRESVIGGSLFDDECPIDEPPESTALSWFSWPS